jgi:hypothetical protein
MSFRVTARDNRTGGGGVASADSQVTVVSSAGPFRITLPSSAVSWSGWHTINWNVAGTASAPVNASNVNIFLSTDGGQTFPLLLASNVPNNGAATVLLPNLTTSLARVKVQAADNIFFDISRANFSITSSSAKSAPTVQLSLSVSNGLALLTWNSQSGNVYRVQFQDSPGGTWSNAGLDIVATNTSTTVSYALGSSSSRFYRVIQVQ